MVFTSHLVRARNRLKQSLNQAQRDKLAKIQALRFRGLQRLAYRLFVGSNLKALAILNKSDKWGTHWYAQHYERHFAPLRRKRLNILEIGVGGWNDSELGGGSLRMWRTYFPRSRIYGIDVCDKSLHDEPRIKTFMGSQVDEQFLDESIRVIGRLDIVIDDGSHLNQHVLRTFELLFPRLTQDGIYVIEDTQTSYWRDYGGSSTELNRVDTIVGFLKTLVDGLNYEEFETEQSGPSYYEQNIVAIHFYHNLVFIQKGRNTEGSSVSRHPE
jgi:hypothetical protein